ncbi:MAG: prenyltransferase, partial [Planctomycetia bacterium]|nr:prenyltransferase [Planctomycetia bacterium]
MNRLSAIPRRKFLLGLGAAGLAACTWPRRAQAADEETITPEAQKAIERGLDYLVREQKTGGRFAGAYGAMGYPSGVAVTAMAGLAMLASGDPPGEGKYG